ncbi:MAG TPA: hypothetical protein VIP98_18345 [Microlunatus sp.]
MAWRKLEDEDRERQRGVAIPLGAGLLGCGVLTGLVLILGNADRAVMALIAVLIGAVILSAGVWRVINNDGKTDCRQPFVCWPCLQAAVGSNPARQRAAGLVDFGGVGGPLRRGPVGSTIGRGGDGIVKAAVAVVAGVVAGLGWFSLTSYDLMRVGYCGEVIVVSQQQAFVVPGLRPDDLANPLSRAGHVEHAVGASPRFVAFDGQTFRLSDQGGGEDC